MTKFAMPRSRRVDLWSARIEAYLTTRAFLLLFLIGYVAMVGIFYFWGFYKQFKVAADEPVMRYFIATARGAGFVLNITTALVILLASKLLITLIRETPLQLVLPLDNSFPYFHVVVGYTIVAAVCVHAVFHFVWIAGWDNWEWGWFGFNMSVITGIIILITFATMLVFATRKQRREHFRRFYVVHVVGAVIFFALLFVHGLYYREPETYKWITGPIVIYLLDRAIRHFRTKSASIGLSNEGFELKGHGIIFLRIPKQFGYRAGQYAELLIPEINREWHPFTIASAPHEDEMHFFIKALGDWTCALEEKLKERQENPDKDLPPLTIRMKGPYGAPAQHVRSYHRVVLVSGGVGSTPFSSICKSLHHLQATEKHTTSEQSRRDTAMLHNVNRRVLQRLADMYAVDLDQLCNTVEVEEVGFRGHHLINMAEMLGTKKKSDDPIDDNDTNAPLDDNPDLEEGSTPSDETGDADLPPNPRGVNFAPAPAEDTAASPNPGAVNFSPTPIADNTAETMEQGLMRHVGSVFYDIAGPNLASRKSVMPQHTGSVEQLKKEKLHKRSFKEQMKFIYDKRAKVLAFAHTTRVSFLMLLSLILRTTMLSVALIIGAVSLRQNVPYSRADWIITADTVLGLLLALQTTTTILLEISFMGMSFFSTFARLLDFFLLVPLVLLSNAYGIRTWITNGDVAAWYIGIHFFIFIPGMFLLLGHRLYRSIGSHTLLRTAPTTGEFKANVPSVDFLWTTPRHDDDKWLREELNPLASGSELRLHRFVTRAGDDEIKTSEEYIHSTRAGRPQWDELLRQVMLETPSNNEIGVFFCGPAPMGAALQKSLMKIEVLSNLRSAYLNTTPRRELITDLQLQSARTIGLLKKTACNIRFVYREENFGY